MTGTKKHKKVCMICGKVQAMLEQDEPVEPAECNDPNNATCRRFIAGHDAKMKKKAQANKKALAGENKAAAGSDGVVDLEDLNTKELKAKCKELGLTGFSKMKKPALIDLIYQASKAGAA